MDTNKNGNVIKKHEEESEHSIDAKLDKRDNKQQAVKPLNRVPRACNACRKQKMRCEGADNPPCRRCRNAGLDCLFEKPSKEATLTGEAGLERIRSLETHVAEIRVTQAAMQNTLQEIAYHLRHARSPSGFTSYQQQSPHVQSMASPTMSTTTNSASILEQNMSLPASTRSFTSHVAANSVMTSAPRQPRDSMAPGYRNSAGMPSPPSAAFPTGGQAPSYGSYPPGVSGNSYPTTGNQPPVLPPFSSISNPPGPHQDTSGRYPASDPSQIHRSYRSSDANNKRPAGNVSRISSPVSSDNESDDEDGLPSHGLVAPWEVLRGLADVAIQRANKENGEASEPPSRAPTPGPGNRRRPSKRRKLGHKANSLLAAPDIVTKNIVSDNQARELFRIFFQGCSTFLPVFNAQTDTFDTLRARSPFAVDSICMVAARVRDGGDGPSELYTRCLDEVQNIARATLFLPVPQREFVQAMIIVSGWSDNGWLSGGHAIRMAFELSMHKAWPKLLKRMRRQKPGDPMTEEDRELVIASRTWFCLYLFEHQMSYGTGRPAVLKDDESIGHSRLLLQHPLAQEDDMRLVSTVELITIREKIHNKLAPYDQPVDDHTFAVLQEADEEFATWYKTWDGVFARKYEGAAFYRQSLQIQQVHAQLFHNATGLRGISGPDDVRKMPEAQRQLALRSIDIAQKGLEITVNASSYREGMKYAVHYTHATATFAASFLLRLARLFPNDCDQTKIRSLVEDLVSLLAQIPGKRYALTLQLMLDTKKRKREAMSRLPQVPREQRSQQPPLAHIDPNQQTVPINHGHVRNTSHEAYTPTYESHFSPEVPTQGIPVAMPVDIHGMIPEPWDSESLPVWLTDGLGGHPLQQYGLDAFLLPPDYVPAPSQTWG